MKLNVKVVVCAAVATVVVVCVGAIAWRRIVESRRLTQPCRVRTYGNTNYVVQVLETTVGKTDSGYVLIVYARFQNPNAFEVVLNRDWFVLVDHDKDYFQPTTNGTQTTLIRLPPNGVLEREMLSFALPENSLAGTIGLMVGQNYRVMLKDEKPFGRPLRSGEFVSFRRREW